MANKTAEQIAKEALERAKKKAARNDKRGTVEPQQGGVPCDGAELLRDVHAFLGRFVAYPSAHAHVAHTLWIAHCHLMEAWDSTPRIAFLSPEPARNI